MNFEIGGCVLTGLAHGSNLVVESFSPGNAELRTNDSDRPQRDGAMPGMDLLGVATWSWEISARGLNATEALAANAALAAAWRPRERLQSGVRVPLTYELNGRRRTVYGRPGRFAGLAPDYMLDSGYGKITCDFRVLDPLSYDESESSITLSIVPASTGGIVAPIVAPVSTLSSDGSPRAGFVMNTGDAPAPLRVVFHGPVTDPWVRAAAGWEVGIIGSLAYDETVTVDALAGTVKRNKAPAAGLLTRATRLSAAALPPGRSELAFGGTDQTGTASVTIAWRNAHTSI